MSMPSATSRTRVWPRVWEKVPGQESKLWQDEAHRLQRALSAQLAQVREGWRNGVRAVVGYLQGGLLAWQRSLASCTVRLWPRRP